MGDVVGLNQARRRRAARLRAVAAQSVMHPALRWVSDEDDAAHRRTRDGRTACGSAGPLVLADREMRPCPVCYPGRTGT